MTRIIQLAIAATTLIAVSRASAGMIVTVEETGGDVVMTGNGTLDISALPFDALFGQSPFVVPNDRVRLGQDATGGFYNLNGANLTGPTAIGPGTDFLAATSGSGQMFGINWGGLTPLSLTVPQGYVSGDPLSGSATYTGHTFSSIGLTEGTYTWTWDTATGSDFFTMDIVPEPGTGALLSVAGLVLLRRRRS